jgi:BirA family biotin operon repressor/biotin-[acetyl-CoA-carboxylase] ligase
MQNPEIIKVKSTSSTNQCLRELSQKEVLREGTVLYAKEQTAGRGQMGTHWEAAPNKNITCSMLFHPIFLPMERHFLLSEAVALGVKETLEIYYKLKHVSIKWPNDIYYKDKKIAGILIENEIQGNMITQSIAGIGLNVNQEVFTGGAPNPISLKRALRSSEDIDMKQLLHQMTGQIDYWYRKLRSGEYETIVQKYFDAQSRRLKYHFYKDNNGEVFRAKIKRITDSGFLELLVHSKDDYRKYGKYRSYAFKEISYIFQSGTFETNSKKPVYF